jgi:hypothetical protein
MVAVRHKWTHLVSLYRTGVEISGAIVFIQPLMLPFTLVASKASKGFTLRLTLTVLLYSC